VTQKDDALQDRLLDTSIKAFNRNAYLPIASDKCHEIVRSSTSEGSSSEWPKYALLVDTLDEFLEDDQGSGGFASDGIDCSSLG